MPAKHPVQFVLPAAGEKYPVTHSMQIEEELFGACLPGRQGRQEIAPPPDHIPEGQIAHSPRASDSAKKPPGHASHTSDFSTEANCPGKQAEHFTLPRAFAKEPREQDLHWRLPYVSAKNPMGHFSQTVSFVRSRLSVRGRRKHVVDICKGEGGACQHGWHRHGTKKPLLVGLENYLNLPHTHRGFPEQTIGA